MPYASKEKKREWIEKYKPIAAARDKAVREKLRRENPQTGQAYRPLRGGLVTWAELQDDLIKVKAIKSFDACVAAAKEAIVIQKEDRLKVAALCIQACVIRKGGDFKSGDFKTGFYGASISDFARAIKVHEKTLGTWVQIYDQIRKLPAGTPVDFTAASMAIRSEGWRAQPEVFQKAYLEHQNPAMNTRRVYGALRYVRSAASAISATRPTDWTEKDKANMDHAINLLNEIWGNPTKRSAVVGNRKVAPSIFKTLSQESDFVQSDEFLKDPIARQKWADDLSETVRKIKEKRKEARGREATK